MVTRTRVIYDRDAAVVMSFSIRSLQLRKPAPDRQPDELLKFTWLYNRVREARAGSAESALKDLLRRAEDLLNQIGTGTGKAGTPGTMTLDVVRTTGALKHIEYSPWLVVLATLAETSWIWSVNTAYDHATYIPLSADPRSC